MCVCAHAYMHVCLFMRVFTTCFPLVTNACVHTVLSKAVSTSQILHLSVVTSCVHYTWNKKNDTPDSVTLKSCEGLAILNWHGVIPSNEQGVKIPPRSSRRGWRYPLEREKIGSTCMYYIFNWGTQPARLCAPDTHILSGRIPPNRQKDQFLCFYHCFLYCL